MNWMIFLMFLTFNVGTIFLMHRWQNRALERKLRQVRQEIEEMEDLVSAIIAEFEEAAVLNRIPAVSEQTGMGADVVEDGLLVADSPEISEPQPEPVFSDVALMESPELETEEVEAVAVVESKEASPPLPAEPETVKILALAPKYQQILELHHQGAEVEEIAKQLAVGRGEVQLILGLYQRS